MRPHGHIKRVFSIALILLISIVTGQNLRAFSIQRDNSLAARIQRIENGLVPNPGFVLKGQTPRHATIFDRMRDYRVPGVSIAVINDDKIEWAKAYGLKEAGGNDPVSSETLFQAASISKSVSAAAALYYVEKGLLTLDENVNDKLRSWKVPDNEWTKEKKVTLRGILSHSAGLTVSGFPGYVRGSPVPTLRQILEGEKPANTAPIRVDIEIGSRFRYAGGGYTVMQQLLMDVLNKPFPEIMKETVLDRIGMTDSTYEQPLPERLLGRETAGHLMNGMAIKEKWHTYPELAAAGLWTTPTDLCRFAIEIMLSEQGKSNKVLSKTMVGQMLTLQKGDFGLGLVLRGTKKEFHFTHSGGNAGFRCIFLAFPERGQGAAVMTNGDPGSDLFMEILRSLGLEYGWSFYDPKVKIPAEIRPKKLNALAGTYQFTPASQITIIMDKDGLVAESLYAVPTGWTKCELYPQSEAEFFNLKTEDIITFIRDPAGNVTGLMVKRGPQERKAAKIK